MSDKLLGKMIKELTENNISIKFVNKSTLEDDSPMLGFFCELDKLIEVGTLDDGWFQTFAHEYCHFKQWKDGLFDDITTIAAYATLDNWVDRNRELPSETVKKFIRCMQFIEWDNEKRTIEFLDKNKIDYDREAYVKRANVYVASHELTRRIRRWQSKPLSTVPGVSDLFSGEEMMLERDFGNLPEGFEALAISSFEEVIVEEEED